MVQLTILLLILSRLIPDKWNEESTSGLSQRTTVDRTKMDDVYKGNGYSSVPIVKRYYVVKIEKSRLFYKGERTIELTNKDGNLKSPRPLLKVLGKRRLEKTQNSLEAIKMEEIVVKKPAPVK